MEIVHLLIKRGIPLDSQDQMGNTVLHEAAHENNIYNYENKAAAYQKAEVIDALIKANASTTIKNKKGQTALEVAKDGTFHITERAFEPNGYATLKQKLDRKREEREMEWRRGLSTNFHHRSSMHTVHQEGECAIM